MNQSADMASSTDPGVAGTPPRDFWWKFQISLMVVGLCFLVGWGVYKQGLYGTVYVQAQTIKAQNNTLLPIYTELKPNATDEEKAKGFISWQRTLGVWLAAAITLAVFSSLFRDNMFYKLAESLMVGVSAGYWFVVAFWSSLVPLVFAKLLPDLAQATVLPGLQIPPGSWQIFGYTAPDLSALFPLLLGAMLLARLIPSFSWLARWPLALIVGTMAGLRLVLIIESDFVEQIRSTILPLIVMVPNSAEAGAPLKIDWLLSLRNTSIIACVISSLSYFIFSIEHRGAFGRLSRVGVFVLMITFGASFAYTVMGRITLLTMRLEFLFKDWLQFDWLL
ncbi:hypothetical protein [Planctopirus hydrillae]|nr:hypothetical protein [Planctopirus hydrillae]